MNPALMGLNQIIPVEPNTEYEFSSYVRSEDLVTSSGPRFQIVDAFTPHQYVLSDDLIGFHSWEQVQARFKTAPDARFLVLQLVRSPSDPMVRGNFWADDVSIVKAEER